MYYQSIEDSNNFLVDERYDDMFPTNNNQQGEHKLEHALKKLSIDNHTTTNNENVRNLLVKHQMNENVS